ncbi:hypothetical protein ACVWZR_008144 [Bradyrhizobium sp. i1.3.1]
MKPGVNANGSFRIAIRLMSLATASKVAFALAAVPPDSVPRHVAHAAFHTRGRSAEHAFGLFLHDKRTELERHGIETA